MSVQRLERTVAILTIRVTPKMSDSPAATKNRPEAEADPLCVLKQEAFEAHAGTL